jgi:hypothetical protein
VPKCSIFQGFSCEISIKKIGGGLFLRFYTVIMYKTMQKAGKKLIFKGKEKIFWLDYRKIPKFDVILDSQCITGIMQRL